MKRWGSCGREVLVGLALVGAGLGCNGGDGGLGSGSDPMPGSSGDATDGDDESTTAAMPSTGAAEADGTATGDATDTATDDGPDPDSSGGPPLMCEPVPSCQAPLPDAGPELPWEHTESSLVVASGGPRHRGRDMFYNPGDPQWAMAKFAYGPTDWDLEDEQVDVYVLRGCEGDWEFLGPTLTTNEGGHMTVEGVEDTGGRVYFQIPIPLGVGRHRVHMVVRGDGTRADAYIEVVEPGTPIILSDIDGTLTTDEWERLIDFLLDEIPDVNEGAPQALQALVDKGYRPMYLTARPEFLGDRTYAFIEQRGLPPGIIHTTLTGTGALGGEAVSYKTAELMALAARGLVPSYVFGNTDSDAEAYANAGIQPLQNRIFFQYEDALGGRTIQSYLELVDEFEALDLVCE